MPSTLLTILAGWPSGLRRLFQVPVTNILHCYKLTVLLACNQFENNNIGRMAEWSKSHCCHATLLQIKSFNCQKEFENNEQHSFNCINYTGRMAEWSKALVSGTSHFDGVGSNPTPVMLHCYKLTVFGFKKDNSRILNNITSTVLTILALWLSGPNF